MSDGTACCHTLHQVKKTADKRGWDLECKDQAVIADMGGSNLNMKLDSFPTITARKTAHIGSQRYTDGQMFKNSLGAKARLSDFNSCPKTLLDVTDVDDKLFADMQQTRLPASALGHATGNAMSISVVERIVARRRRPAEVNLLIMIVCKACFVRQAPLCSRPILDDMPVDRWAAVYIYNTSNLQPDQKGNRLVFFLLGLCSS